MTGDFLLNAEAAAELHRIARQIVSQILDEPIAAGGSVPDALMILGKRIVGVVVECFMLSYDGKVIELISTAAPTTCSGPPQRTPGQTLGCSDGRHWRATAAAIRAVVGK